MASSNVLTLDKVILSSTRDPKLFGLAVIRLNEKDDSGNPLYELRQNHPKHGYIKSHAMCAEHMMKFLLQFNDTRLTEAVLTQPNGKTISFYKENE